MGAGATTGTFSASPAGLIIDASNGEITPSSSTPGTYTVTNTIAASGGCAATSATASVTITNRAVATFSYAATPYCTTVSSAKVALGEGATAGTFSASPAGLIIDASNGEITPSSSTPGTYTVTNTIAASGGCAATSATASVTITAAPIAAFSYAGSPYCTSATGSQAATLASGASTGTFTAATGLSLDASTGAITASTSAPGTYTVTNTIAASGGCAAVTATATVIINAVPAITGQPQSASKTVDQSVTFTATATGTGLSYQWYKGTPGPQTAISGATNATYSIASLTTSDADDYYVVVSGTCAPALLARPPRLLSIKLTRAAASRWPA
ncbi:putative Ig domain-containing protein [Hymenobacter humi]|uniref:Ig domain-containing protein n=1 Tax=Hymenobacter humi TaxID=1411620 RepID=A0ABW2U0Y5_9BACT